MAFSATPPSKKLRLVLMREESVHKKPFFGVMLFSLGVAVMAIMAVDKSLLGKPPEPYVWVSRWCEAVTR